MSKIKTDALGKICIDTAGKICICPDGYTVVFPSTDGYPYERSYPLTEVDGVWIGGGTVIPSSFFFMPFDIAWSEIQFPVTSWQAEVSIEMTIDGGTGERSVRTVSDITTVDLMSRTWTGQSDYTEVFADGTTFNLSASSTTVRPVVLS